MSDEEPDSGVLDKAYRTVSPRYEGHPVLEMDIIGWGMVLGLLILVVPLLPFIILVWLITKILDVLSPSSSEPETAE